MAYTQNPGRSPLLKTGNGIPSALLQQDPKPNFKGSTDKGDMGGGYLGDPNTDLLKVAKYYGSKVVSKVKDVVSKTGETIVKGGNFLAETAEGKHGSSGYSQSDESMRQKNIARNKK